MRKKTLIKGAIIVLIASIMIRVLGFFFRIYLAENLGAQGMGIYQLIISLYMMVATFATSGITFSVSRMVAENSAIKKHSSPTAILKISTWWAFLISSALAIVLVVFANEIGTFILREPKTIESIYFIAAGIPFMAVAACLKGYFFAMRKAQHPSNASVIEQAVKMAIIMWLLGFFLNEGTSKACAIVSLGMTIGEVVSSLYLALFYFLDKHRIKSKLTSQHKLKQIFNAMLQISIPIQLSSTFNAALRLLESVLIIGCFKIFTRGNAEIATSTYGIIRGMALPLILFPTSFLQAIVTVLVPELSGASASKNKRTVRLACEKAIQITLFIGVYSTAVFLVFAPQIAKLFYSNPEVGPMLQVLCGLCPFLYAQIMSMGILNAIDEQVAAMKYSIIDAIVRIILITILVPTGGFTAFVVVMYIANIFTFSLYMIKLFQAAALPINLNKLLIKPIIAIIISTLLGMNLEPFFAHVFPKLVSIAAASCLIGAAFLSLLVCFNCVAFPKSELNCKNNL